MRPIKREKRFKRRLLGFDEVVFTHHAWERMRQRRIGMEEVFRTIENPDETSLPAHHPERQHVRWHKNEKTSIDVIYAIDVDTIQVITTYKHSRLAEGIPPKIIRVNRTKRRPKRKRR